MNQNHFATNNLRIDLHIHSAASEYKDGNIVKNSNINNISILLNALESNNINMFSITDHNRFDYELYSTLKKEIYGNKTIKKILPGIEFDVILEEHHPKCHIISIFEDNNEEKLSKLSNIISSFKNISQNDAYSIEEFEILLRRIGLKTILIVHQKQALDNKNGKTESLSSACDNPSYFIKTGYIDSLEYSNSRTEGIVKDSLRSLNIDFPLITGSDCHEWSSYPYRDSKQKKVDRVFTSFKCLPSFKGLLMAISSFNSRANRIDNVNSHYIKNIKIGETEYPLANGLNAIIGDNGAGKSLLLNLLCNGGCKYYDSLVKKNSLSFEYNDSTFQKQSINYIPQGDINKKVREGNLFNKDSEYYDNITTKTIFSENIINYFNNLNEYVLKKIRIEEERQDLKNKNVQIHPVKRNFYLPNIDSNISLESTGKDKERDETLKQKIDSLRNEYENNKEYYIKLNLNESFEKVLTELDLIYKTIHQNYQFKLKCNKARGIISKQLREYSISLLNRRTTEEKNNKDILDSYKKFSNSIIKFIKLENEENKFPVFPNKIQGTVSKQINDYEFTKTARYHNVDLKEEFYKYCFNTEFNSELAVKKLTSKDNYKKALKGCTSLSEIEKFKENKIKGFIEEWSKEMTFISMVTSKTSVGNTPGEISLVYYKFLIQEKEDSFYVLAIDQPEDDINPKRIKDFLLNYLGNIRDKKQILIVTHNPLLVVNLDVDNVIYLNKINNNISIKYGALEYDEEYNILDLIKENLDGGYKAVEGRLKKYDRDDN